jgi:DNA invertase Pin-like site-specific DNA recombinase
MLFEHPRRPPFTAIRRTEAVLMQEASGDFGAKPVLVAQFLRAAQYVRMSTEHQQYSTENQSDVIRIYAEAHGMNIVQTYADDGKSGLKMEGRHSLQQLIADVEQGTAPFDVILVYDVSRWGRFQDADESAYYEYICKRANIAVHYCAEPFVNDGSLPSTLLKTIKRTMAGEYSRELSVKTFAGQCRLIELGFRQGGAAGYGLRRLLVDHHRNSKAILARGERKSLQTDRVILVPGPKEEVAVVREIYQRFTDDGEDERAIAHVLNTRGVLTDFDRLWTRDSVRQILTNPKYIGANVFNRQSAKLKGKCIANPPDMWIRREEAFEPIIDIEVFRRVQEIIAARRRSYSDDEMLELLRQLLVVKGTLSAILIDEADGMPSSNFYIRRFKGLLRAYRLVGYSPRRDISYLEINRRIREYYSAEIAKVIDKLKSVGAEVQTDSTTDLLTINDAFTVSLVLARCREVRAGSFRWFLRLDTSLAPDITIAARMEPGNQAILDYYLLPNIDALSEQLRVAPENGFVLDVYRFTDLAFFLGLARRRTIEEVA